MGLLWLAKAVKGAARKELLSPGYRPDGKSWRKDDLVEEIFEIAEGRYKYKEPPEIKGTGYVVKSLEAALRAFCHSTSFKDGCILAVNLGDDARIPPVLFMANWPAHFTA